LHFFEKLNNFATFIEQAAFSKFMVQPGHDQVAAGFITLWDS